MSRENQERPVCGCRSGKDCDELAVDGIYCSRKWGKCDCQFVRTVPSDRAASSRDRKED